MELCYRGVKAGDYVKVVDESVSMNCDGWGRDLPSKPWNDTSYTAKTMFGEVRLKVWDARAELEFVNKYGWHNSLDHFKEVHKISLEEVLAGHDFETSYEKDSRGEHVPVGTAKKEWIEANK